MRRMMAVTPFILQFTQKQLEISPDLWITSKTETLISLPLRGGVRTTQRGGAGQFVRTPPDFPTTHQRGVRTYHT